MSDKLLPEINQEIEQNDPILHMGVDLGDPKGDYSSYGGKIVRMMKHDTLNDCVLNFIEYQELDQPTFDKIAKYIEDHKYYMGLQYHRDFTWSEAYTNFGEYFAGPISQAIRSTRLDERLETDWLDAFIKVVEAREDYLKEDPKISETMVCKKLIEYDRLVHKKRDKIGFGW
jgi:hypothetical protein